MDIFWKAWSELDEKFVPRNPDAATSSIGATDQERVFGAVQGMAESLGDPYTVFLPPTENEVFEGNIQGQFGGVGMRIGKRDGVLTVISPLEGTPAKRAGLQPNDKILTIDGTTTDGMPVQKAVQLIRGEKGTDVELSILSEGDNEARDVDVTRSTIQIPTIETSQQDGAFIISLYNFSAKSANLFEQSLQKFRRSGTDDLVLDLRGNAGGFLQAAVDVSSHFVDEDKVIVKENYGDKKEPRVDRSAGYGTVPDSTDVAVLVNNGSASASEIVAGALRDHDEAQLVGTQTFGKGSVQELVDLTDNTALKVTVARWLTPNGTSISENGLEPDVVVENNDQANTDNQNGASTTSGPGAGSSADPQLQKAIDIVTSN